ncbi:MAG: hypothetical protein OXG82_05495 [Gammaproteobacteria bacterium]|nr:hypothetical protein [Gammaproteobacteria bacterium]
MTNAAEQSRMTPRGRGPGGAGRLMLPLVGASLVLLLVLAMPDFHVGARDADLDADLCPPDGAVAARAVLLLDLRKPLDPARGLPVGVLRKVAREMGADTELRVFALADDPLAPRVQVGRVCKPYANHELAAPAAKDRPGPRDCDDLPAQLPTRLRGRAQLYCERRAAIERRIAALVAERPPAPVADAYLVEAIDDTILELADADVAAAFHVFSDMAQHAPWYSHLEREPDDWDAQPFAEARRGHPGLLAEPPPAPALAVRVHYVPRRGTTEHPRVARAHKRFWRGYFAGAESVAFDDLTVLGGYEVERLARPAEEPAADRAVETDAARAEREEAARLLELVQAERAALEQAREQAVAEAEQLDARAAELNRREQALARADEQALARADEPEADGADEPEADGAGEADGGPAGEPAPTLAAVPADAPPTAPRGAVPVPTTETPRIEPPTATRPTEPPTETPPTETAAVPRPPAAACPITRRPGATLADAYPNGGWTNHGSADITVNYVIDDHGETLDDEVSVAVGASRTQLPGSMPLFAAAAEELVRSWAFDFTATEACLKRQQRVTVLRFRYRR